MTEKEAREGGTSSRAFVVEDLLDFRIIPDIDIAPAGDAVAYVVEEIDAEADGTYSNLFVITTDGGEPRQLTFGRASNTSPRFSPDGASIAFVSDRAGTPQLFVLRLDGGEARQVTSLRAGAATAVWSPDGGELAFAAAIAVDGPSHAPRATRRLSYKSDGVGFLANAPMHLFVVPVSGGDARELTSGDESAMEPRWTPDGQHLVFSRMRAGRADGHRSDICIVGRDGGPPRQLTHDVAHCAAPVVSPDGEMIAFLGSRREGDARRQLWCVSTKGGDERTLTSDDVEAASYPLTRVPPPIFVDGGKELLVVEATKGRSHVTRVRMSDGHLSSVVTGDRQVAVAVAAAGRIAFLWSDSKMCGRLSAAREDGTQEQILVDVNERWASGRRWPRTEIRDLSPRGEGGSTTSCLLFLPEGEGPFPLLVDVHGGPASFVELGYPYHPYWYVLATRGWVVMSLNPIGSGSYGKEHAEDLRGAWGKLDLPEQLAVVDRLVEDGLVDPHRIAIAGKSYGGYLAAWAASTTKRFCAAIACAPVTNLESHYGTSDSGYYADPYSIGGDIFERRDRYRELSPVEHAQDVTTPTLILQGEEDQRCPKGQAEELFVRMVRGGDAEVELVLYPGGSHALQEKGRPSHRGHYHGHIVAWLEEHCGRMS